VALNSLLDVLEADHALESSLGTAGGGVKCAGRVLDSAFGAWL
jgi:hypothetical protein